MLLTACKHLIISWFLFALTVICLLACKPSGSTETTAENPYLADYEKPAQPWGFIDNEGELIIDAEFDAVSAFSQGLAAVCVDGKWGYIDNVGNFLIQPAYHQAWTFHDGLARVKPFEQPGHYINMMGELIQSADWEAEDDFSEGLARIKYGELFGFIDNSGAIVINPDYTRAWNFEYGLAVVEKDNKVGAINANGQVIIPLRYESITRNLAGNILFAQTGVKSIAFNHAGRELAQIAPGKMLDGDSFNIAIKRSETKWLYNLGTRKYQPDKGFVQLLNLGESRWAAKDANGYRILDKNGEPVSDKYYSQINRFSSGIAAFQRGDYWGYLTVDGVELGEPQFGLAWDFKEGLARAAFRDGIAFITSDMQLAFYPPENTTDLRDFSEGLAPVQFLSW